jgi:hypothetical protein
MGNIQTGWGSSTINSAFVAYRPIVAVADIEYTGTPLYAAGAVRVSSVPMKTLESGTYAYTHNTSVNATAVNNEVRGFDNVQGLFFPSTIVLPARKGFTTRVLPRPSGYAQMRTLVYEPSSSTTLASMAYAKDLALTGVAPGPVYYPNTNAKVISYSGLDSSASITVTVRYCVQIAMSSDNEVAALAVPSPPKDQAETNWYERLSSVLPTVEAMSSVAKALYRGYTGGGFPTLRDEL